MQILQEVFSLFVALLKEQSFEGGAWTSCLLRSYLG